MKLTFVVWYGYVMLLFLTECLKHDKDLGHSVILEKQHKQACFEAMYFQLYSKLSQLVLVCRFINIVLPSL